MKRRSLACILLIAVFIVPSFLVAADKVTQETERGKALFKTQCQVCHINKLEGDQPSAYTRQFHPADFSDPDAWKDLDKREIRNVAKKGRGAMPAQKQLKPAEIEAIAQYLVKTYQP
jgi:mono/diheme cytochrome c family protein